jgi:uncharacterized phiE125 gp8 family phage protein
MSLVLITAPAVEPITLVEARAHLRITADGSPPTHADDDYVTALIQAARQHLDGKDGWLNRALITQTWELVLDEFPDQEIRIPLPPLQSITSIKYDDADGVEQTVDPANYVVDTKAQPGWVVPVSTYSWPSTMDTINAVRVRFAAGYGAAGTNVPMPIRQAMLLLVGAWYQSRESVVIGTIVNELPMAVDALLAPYRTMWFG